jgi:hypothetical protein
MVQTRHCVSTFLLLTLAAAPAVAADKRVPFRFPEGKHGDRAVLKYINDLPVLIVEGGPEEIGEAVGKLAVKPSPRSLDYPLDLLKHHKVEALWGLFVRAGTEMSRQFPPDHKAELEAIIKGAEVNRDKLVVGNTLFDLKKVFACSALLIEKERSATGGPLLARNLDYPSLGYIHEHSLVTVYRPKGKHAFASIGFPGLVGCVSGMNDAGLTLAVLEVVDVKDGLSRFDAKGVPYAMCFRRLLEECSTIAEAKKLLSSLHRTSTLNLAVADRAGVAIFEITPTRIEVREASKGVGVCTNHFCTASIRAERPFNPFNSFERFETLGELQKEKGKLKPDDLRKKLHEVNLGSLTLQTMVFEPETLKLHLAIGSVPASKEPLRTLDLAPLLKKKAE